MDVQIAPSILSSDFGRLNEEVKAVEKYADRLHIDVMDGHFVPNLTFGAPVVSKIKTRLPMDCHLMIHYPENLIEDFANAGADVIIIHQEAKGNTEKAFKLIKKFNKRAGICIKPRTSVSVLTKKVMKYVDYVLIMTVEPGFGGQQFIRSALPKIRKIREMYPSIDIGIDGGINDKTAVDCVKNGANILIAGSYIFHSNNYKEAIDSLRKAESK
jgi:ribulose-phosphate 3-epimerase